MRDVDDDATTAVLLLLLPIHDCLIPPAGSVHQLRRASSNLQNLTTASILAPLHRVSPACCAASCLPVVKARSGDQHTQDAATSVGNAEPSFHRTIYTD